MIIGRVIVGSNEQQNRNNNSYYGRKEQSVSNYSNTGIRELETVVNQTHNRNDFDTSLKSISIT